VVASVITDVIASAIKSPIVHAGIAHFLHR
jgi:hypothetical protein